LPAIASSARVRLSTGQYRIISQVGGGSIPISITNVSCKQSITITIELIATRTRVIPVKPKCGSTTVVDALSMQANGSSVFGQVVDANTGAPIAHAAVRFGELPTDSTDALGNYSFPTPDCDGRTLTVSRPDYV